MQDQLSVPSNFFVNGNNVLYLFFYYKQLNTNNEICWFCRSHKRSDPGKKSNEVETNYSPGIGEAELYHWTTGLGLAESVTEGSFFWL